MGTHYSLGLDSSGVPAAVPLNCAYDSCAAVEGIAMLALFNRVRPWRASYHRSVAESVTRFPTSVQLLTDTSTAMDVARTMRADRPPWWTNCGKRLWLTGELGPHARCHDRA